MADASAPSHRSAASKVPGTIPASCPSSPPIPSRGAAASQNAACRPGRPRQMSAMLAVNAYIQSASGSENSTHPGGRAPAAAARTAASGSVAPAQRTATVGARHSRYTAIPTTSGSTTCAPKSATVREFRGDAGKRINCRDGAGGRLAGQEIYPARRHPRHRTPSTGSSLAGS
jgi:hypothetical protein